jgi:hypothetical protein
MAGVRKPPKEEIAGRLRGGSGAPYMRRQPGKVM